MSKSYGSPTKIVEGPMGSHEGDIFLTKKIRVFHFPKDSLAMRLARRFERKLRSGKAAKTTKSAKR